MSYKDITLYCHTYGRPHRRMTIHRLPKRLQKRAWLVVQKREKEAYDWPRLMVLPDRIRMLSPTRQYILDHARTRKIAIMDDDFKFLRRIHPEDPTDWHMRPTKHADVYDLFDLMIRWLDKYAHCGVSNRLMNNKLAMIRNARLIKHCDRMMNFLCYDVEKVQSVGARFDRVPLKQDFDMTLQLLRAGFQNAVTYEFAVDQIGGSHSKGGCSTYRTPEMMAECAHKLAELHPDVVKVQTVKLKEGWKEFNNERVDVRILWKKAYENSPASRPKGAII